MKHQRLNTLTIICGVIAATTLTAAAVAYLAAGFTLPMTSYLLLTGATLGGFSAWSRKKASR